MHGRAPGIYRGQPRLGEAVGDRRTGHSVHGVTRAYLAFGDVGRGWAKGVHWCDLGPRHSLIGTALCDHRGRWGRYQWCGFGHRA